MSDIDILAILGILVIIYMIIYSILRRHAIPNVNSPESIKGLKSIPSKLSYRYYLDNTGIAFDPEKRCIYLINGEIRKIYDVNEIRDFEYSYGGETQYYGNDFTTAMVNLRNKKYAYNNGGLFISVADINHPKWQIKFSDEDLLLKYFEILRQFTEGTLAPQKDTQPE